LNRPLPPTPGAFDLPPEDWDNAGVVSLINPASNFCSGNRTITVSVQNFGINDIDTVQVHWSLNGVLQSPVTHTTTIDGTSTSNNNTANINLGQRFLAYGISYTIKAW